MSRTLFAILLSELKTIRIVCGRPQCGSVMELSIDRAGSAEAFCPVCNHEFSRLRAPNRAGNALNRAAQALEELQDALAKSDDVQVEFVVPTPPPG